LRNNACAQTCISGATSGLRQDSDAVHNNQNGFLESDYNYRDNGNGTADFELTSFTYWSWVLPKYYIPSWPPWHRFNYEHAFIFAMSYALTYLFPDTTFQGDVTVHFPSCWKTTYDLLDTSGQIEPYWRCDHCYLYPDLDTLIPYYLYTGYYVEKIIPCDYSHCCAVTFHREVRQHLEGPEFYLTFMSLNLDSSEVCSLSPDSCYNVCKYDFWSETSIDFKWIKSDVPPYYYGRFIFIDPLGSPYRIGTSGDELHFDNLISVQPNPAQDKLNIKFVTPVNGNYSYNIYDYQGNFIESVNINATNRVFNYELDLSKYTEGVYFIKSNDIFSGSVSNSFVVIK
jgi:hypothetical protein